LRRKIWPEKRQRWAATAQPEIVFLVSMFWIFCLGKQDSLRENIELSRHLFFGRICAIGEICGELLYKVEKSAIVKIVQKECLNE
jgi:hypothetical protein